MKLPAGWLPRDWRALIALVASVAGSIVLTGYAAMVTVILWRGGWSTPTEMQRVTLLGKALLLSLAGSLVVLISLGLAINRRSIKVTRAGLDMTGGDDPAAPLATITTTTAIAAPTPPETTP